MKVKIKLRNSVVILADDEVRGKLEKFNLAGKTPIDCMNLIRQIKGNNGNEQTASV